MAFPPVLAGMLILVLLIVLMLSILILLMLMLLILILILIYLRTSRRTRLWSGASSRCTSSSQMWKIR